MKRAFILAVVIFLAGGHLSAQNKKSAITSFSFSGYEPSIGGSDGQELYFIGDNSARLADNKLLADEVIRYTEQELKKFLGYELVPAKLERAASVPDQMSGRLMMMETVTDKKAFKELGYDEVIEVQCRVGSQGRTGKYYRPFIEVSIKVTGKDGKTTWKKKEKVKLDEKVEASLVQEESSGSGLGISFSRKNDKSGNGPQGVSAMQLLDWYKQVLGNALVK